jgi:uncharacterized protein (UPF0210 family)
MIRPSEVIETIKMIQEENLDIRTITMGISLRDCCHSDGKIARKKIYDKILKKQLIWLRWEMISRESMVFP